MPDRELRGLERRVRGGDEEEGARLLAERLRGGQLDRERVELLAYLGHGPAARLLDGAAPAPPRGLESWVRGLGVGGKQVWVQAAVAAARMVLPYFERRSHDRRPREAIEACEAWLTASGAPSPRARLDALAERAHAAAEAAYLVFGGEGVVALTLPGDAQPELVIELAESFRESRAAVQAALAAAEAADRSLTHAVLAAVAARERLALGETPVVPGKRSALHQRAAYADRLGQLPELNTPSANEAVRESLRVQLLAALAPEAAA